MGALLFRWRRRRDYPKQPFSCFAPTGFAAFAARCQMLRIWSNPRVLINLPLYPLNANAPIRGRLHLDGGEGGIRTLDTFPYTHFPGVRLRPLGHLSGLGAELTTTLPCRTKNPCLKGRADADTEVVILRGLGPVQVEPDRLAVLGPYYPI